MFKHSLLLRILSVLIFCCVLLTACTGNSQSANTFKKTVTSDDSEWNVANGEEVVLENDRIRFVLNSQTTHFTVTDLSNGKIYNSVPDENAVMMAGEYASRMQSEVTVVYYQTDSSALNMYSASDSVELNNYEIKVSDSAVRVYYNFGTKDIFCPQILRVEDFEKISNSLTSNSSRIRLSRYYKLYDKSEPDADFNEMVKTYPVLKKTPLYIINDDVSELQIEEISDYMSESGYSKESYEKTISNLKIVLQEREKTAGFEVPVEYSINDDGFTAKILADKVTENSEAYKLQSIDFLEYFASVGQEENGYYFVPDGSGAVITVNNGSNDIYKQTFYGDDYSVQSESQTQLKKNLSLPIFGYIGDGNGILGIVESASEVATLSVCPINSSSPRNHMYCSFNVRNIDVTTTGSENVVYNLFSKHLLQVAPQIRFVLLEGQEATDAGVVEKYRNYLLGDGQIKGDRITNKKEVPLYLDYYCMATEDATFLGVPYTRKTVLSTFKEIRDSVKKLHKSGIKNLVIRLYGFGEDGLEHKAANTFSIDKRVGTKKELLQLVEVVENAGGKIYVDADFQFVYKFGNGFKASKDAAHYLNRVLVRNGRYDIVSRVFDKENMARYFVSPSLYKQYAEGYIVKLNKILDSKNNLGLSYGTSGAYLGGDYTDKKDINRVQSVELLTNALYFAQKSGYEMMFDTGNAYVIPFANDLVNVPLNSSEYNVEQYSIPLYQMLLHGSVSYSADAYNISKNAEYVHLKSMEYGASMHAALITSDDLKLRNTKYNSILFSMSDSERLDEIVEMYKSSSLVLNTVIDAHIIDNEMVETDVYVTSYDNGVKIAVNYGPNDVTIGNTVVESKNYAICK